MNRPDVPTSQTDAVLAVLTSHIKQMPQSTDVDTSTALATPASTVTTVNDLAPLLAIGFNTVAKALEARELVLVIACVPVRPCCCLPSCRLFTTYCPFDGIDTILTLTSQSPSTQPFLHL